MGRVIKLAIVSDIHYASAAEQARGDDYEFCGLNPLVRFPLKVHRHFLWLRHPLRQNHLLDQFLEQAGSADYVIANGDYSCDSAFVGVSDDAACQSARECLAILREKFGPRLHSTIGDHELGKMSFVGARGGMRLASYRRVRQELGLEPFWRLELGRYVLIGLVSSLVALPVFRPDTLPEEFAAWEELREQHLAEVRAGFAALKPDQRVVLFCHDPTALPFLARDDVVRTRLPQIEQTIIGHLHSSLILWKSRVLAGIPPVGFLGHTAKRMSTALNQARHWKPFHVRLCPSLAGVELLKDGGYLTAELDPDAARPARFVCHAIRR